MASDPQSRNTTPSALWINLNHQVACDVTGLLQPFPARLTRLSEQGAWIQAEIELEIGRRVTVGWRYRVDRTFRLTGQIVAMKQEPDSLVRLYGIRFVDLPAAEHDLLIREILEIDRRSKARPEKESFVSKQVSAKLGTKRAAYRVATAFATRYGRAGENKRPGKARNVSSGGIGFETIETFPVGTILEFALDLPTEVLKRAKLAPGGEKTIHGVPVRPFEKLVVKGRIVKADRPKLTVPWEYGIAFVDPDPLAVSELRRYVHLSQLDALNRGIRDPR